MMRPGPLIRRLFGPYEREITEAYRRLFIDLDEFRRPPAGLGAAAAQNIGSRLR